MDLKGMPTNDFLAMAHKAECMAHGIRLYDGVMEGLLSDAEELGVSDVPSPL